MSRRAPALAVLALLLAGCSTAPPPTAAPAEQTSTTTPPDPVEVCANQLDYWVGERLRGVTDTYEYQAMGLTGEQYQVLLPLSDEAVRLRDSGGLTDGWVRERARALCVDIVAKEAARPSEAGWP